MRYKLDIFMDAYSAFDKYGYDDGDHPLANDARDRVKQALEDLGWKYLEVSSIHNDHIVELTDPDGRRYDLDWIYEAEGAEYREEMVKRGCPSELIKTPDELNASVIEEL